MKAPRIWAAKPCDEQHAAAVARELAISPTTARLLCIRGLADVDQARRFLAPSLGDLHDPFGLTDMAPAVDRILGAIARGERVAIHGDYDVDGITSTVILRRALELLGADVIHFIPERLRDGYGLQPAALDRLHADGVRLVISVDCGIRADEAARHALALGLDLIVTDHHEPDAALPPALAVINPKRRDCPYPDKNLAGVGVALKVVQALCLRAGRTAWLPAFVKVAAIGTLADVVPLVGENRIIAKLGLEMLSAGPNKVGLRALLDVCGLTGKTIDSYHIGFVLGPRVNAAGRMSTPDIAARLLLASDEAMADEARALAGQLDAENLRRQKEEAEIVAQARTCVETDLEIGSRTVIVVGGEGWHRGVIGIVASKLVDAFHRPAIVLSVDGGIAHGSCRSIPAFDMLAALESCADLMTKFGGHRQAAGLTIDASRVRDLRARINEHADACLQPDDLRPRLWIDGTLGFRSITEQVAAELTALAPFGPGNPCPVFRASGVEVVDGPRLLKERHLKMSFRQDGRVMRGIAWRAAEREQFVAEHRTAIDVAFSLEQDTWNGDRYLQLSVADFRAPES
ncbi:MAG: single-stranded-DNA-specific exonuclease RecJ [Acidobacteria bacterium RIFCSPLOWO2_12_FULL_67_14]|nr:MAG: single-stranded-DNA-specific exonuclease RecJ [Acidobacteria bacterium RIFCSPLOWO2_02_FULL_67_21]OFW36663.1 MAG: single-stranded-DNA-specific exonuclease RecJ [Acidobacteria bacterium RIFCSPLOWO2_12_FULL_67_14]